jgi:hypothetical protein
MADGVIVFSGDTRPNDNLTQMARDADILVHEVASRPALDRLLTEPAMRARLDAVIGFHTTVDEVDRAGQICALGTKPHDADACGSAHDRAGGAAVVVFVGPLGTAKEGVEGAVQT